LSAIRQLASVIGRDRSARDGIGDGGLGAQDAVGTRDDINAVAVGKAERGRSSALAKTTSRRPVMPR
jgi:hypothetical protein